MFGLQRFDSVSGVGKSGFKFGTGGLGELSLDAEVAHVIMGDNYINGFLVETASDYH